MIVRGARERQGGVEARAGAGDDEGKWSRFYTAQSAGMAARWRDLPDERWNGTLDFFGTRAGLADVLEASCSTSSTTAARYHHLPPADGLDRAADLRPERRRAVAAAPARSSRVTSRARPRRHEEVPDQPVGDFVHSRWP